MDKEFIEQLVTDVLEEDAKLFLISLDFLPENKISIVIDGDEGVSLSECIRINRAVEGSLDREKEDFSMGR